MTQPTEEGWNDIVNGDRVSYLVGISLYHTDTLSLTIQRPELFAVPGQAIAPAVEWLLTPFQQLAIEAGPGDDRCERVDVPHTIRRGGDADWLRTSESEETYLFRIAGLPARNAAIEPVAYP
jgi:hypothetical protein